MNGTLQAEKEKTPPRDVHDNSLCVISLLWRPQLGDPGVVRSYWSGDVEWWVEKVRDRREESVLRAMRLGPEF
jgi:hypothetical protein